MKKEMDDVIKSTIFNFWYEKYEGMFPLASGL